MKEIDSMHKAPPVSPNAEASRASVSLRVQAEEIRDHLLRTPRQLPSRYFYDALGSALFDAICELPWYAITRAESALLESHAAHILPRGGDIVRLVELGAGSGAKLAALLTGAGIRDRDLSVHLVDVSARALDAAAHAVAATGAAPVFVHEQPYEEGLRDALASAADGATLVLFLGSNIGNFDRDAADLFLERVCAAMQPGDQFLIGADLVKPEADLLLAYDDPIGVTGAFNRNLLHRLNRELGADFRVDRFEHRAVWRAAESRVDMHLVSLERQTIHVRDADVTFTMEPGEIIWTESSHKYTADEVAERVERAGFGVSRQWVDERHRFALTLATVPPPAPRRDR